MHYWTLHWCTQLTACHAHSTSSTGAFNLLKFVLLHEEEEEGGTRIEFWHCPLKNKHCIRNVKNVTEAENRQKMNTRPRLYGCILNVKQKNECWTMAKYLQLYMHQPDYTWLSCINCVSMCQSVSLSVSVSLLRSRRPLSKSPLALALSSLLHVGIGHRQISVSRRRQ